MANSATVLPRSLAWRLHLVASANRAVLRVCHGNPLLYFKLLGKSYRLYREHGFLPDETLRLGLWNGNGGARIIEGNSRWDPPVLGGIKNAIRVLEENLPRS